jgi:hypothetical protein
VFSHRALDAAVDACYGKQFKNTNDRMRELFRLYRFQLSGGQGDLLDKQPRKKKSVKSN